MRQPLNLMKDHFSRATTPCPTLKVRFLLCLFVFAISVIVFTKHDNECFTGKVWWLSVQVVLMQIWQDVSWKELTLIEFWRVMRQEANRSLALDLCRLLHSTKSVILKLWQSLFRVLQQLCNVCCTFALYQKFIRAIDRHDAGGAVPFQAARVPLDHCTLHA